MFSEKSPIHYEGIKLEIKFDFSSRFLKLIFTQFPYRLNEPIFHTHLVLLNEDHQFIQMNENIMALLEGIYWQVIDPHQAILTLTEIEGSLVVYPNGVFILKKISTSFCLEFITTHTIKVEGPITAQKIILGGQVIDIQNTLCIQDKLILQADQLLQANSSIEAKNIEIIGKGHFNNDGSIMAQEQLKLEINTVVNRGALLAKKISFYSSTVSLLNTGLIKGIEMKVEALSLINTGVFMSLKNLFLEVQQMFKHQQNGVLAAEETLGILAKDLHLLGKLMATGEVHIRVTETFDYATEALGILGSLKLVLQQGYSFKKPVGTLGSLMIKSNSDIQIQAALQAAKEIKLVAYNLAIEKGGVFADGNLKIKVINHCRMGSLLSQEKVPIGEEAYLVSNGKMMLNATLIQNNGGILYANHDFILDASSSLNNVGSITIQGSAKITAPLFTHKILTRIFSNGADALSAKPSLTVVKDCVLQGNTEILGGEIHAGESLLFQGNVTAHSFRSYRSWFDTQLVKGGRKGPLRGHHYYEQKIPREKTLAIYDSQISAGKEIKIDGMKFINQGACRASNIDIRFQELRNKNSFLPFFKSFAVNIPLKSFFRENVLFGKSQDERYVYGPTLPLGNKGNLKPPILLEFESPRTRLLFAPIIEEYLIQCALHHQLRSGYLDNSATSSARVLSGLRENTYALRSAINCSLAVIKQQDIAISEQALLYYQRCWLAKEQVLEPILYLPRNFYEKINMGSNDEAVLRGEKVSLIGGVGALLENMHRIEADHTLILLADNVNNIQTTDTNWTPMSENLKKRRVYVPTKQAIANRGVIKGNRIEIEAQNFLQMGGGIYSGVMGTQLKVRTEMLIKPLPITTPIQGLLSRKGRNYHIEPGFIPAKFVSEGDQQIQVTEGSFFAEAVFLRAKKLNRIKAAQDLYFKNAQADFELASVRTRRQIIEGKSYIAFPVIIEGQAIELYSLSASIRLVNVQLLSTQDTRLKAKDRVEVLNGSAQTIDYIQTRRRKGLQWKNQSAFTIQTEVLPSQLMISGNLSIESKETQLKAVRGRISKDLNIKSARIFLTGSPVAQEIRIYTRNVGVNFFGLEALNSLLAGKGKQALNHLITTEPFIQATKIRANNPDQHRHFIHTTQMLVEGWRFAAFMARASQENAVLGMLADRYEITVPRYDKVSKKVVHSINPKLTFRLNKNIIHTVESCMISTSLIIGNHCQLVGTWVHCVEGTQIKANTIIIQAKKFLEMMAACDKVQVQQGQKEGHLMIRGSSPFEGIGVYQGQYLLHNVYYNPAIIKARNLLSILVGKRLQAKGVELQGEEVVIQAIEILIESLQDIRKEKNHYQGITVDKSFHLTGMGCGKTSELSASVNKPATIHAINNLTLLTRHLIQKGSILSAQKTLAVLSREQQRSLSWRYEDFQDIQKSRGREVNFLFQKDSFPLTGSIVANRKQQRKVTPATLEALDLSSDVASPVSRNPDERLGIAVKKHTTVSMPLIVPSFNRIKEDWKEIKMCLRKNLLA